MWSRLLRVVSLAGFALFATAFVICLLRPASLERRAHALLIDRLRAEVTERYPAVASLQRFSGLQDHLLERLHKSRRFLDVEAPGLGGTLDRVADWARGRYEGLSAELLRDLRIFTGTSAALLLLAFLAARSSWAPPRLMTILSAALVGACALGAWLYLFNQDWLHTLIFSDYVGSAYLVWVGSILFVELDILLNQARIVRGVLDAVAGFVQAALSAG